MEPKVDFSKFSRVQASLKESLMEKYDEKKQLDEDELDMVAAAAYVRKPYIPHRRNSDKLSDDELDMATGGFAIHCGEWESRRR